MRWWLALWAGVVVVLVGCASHRAGTTTAAQHAGQTALEVVIRLGLAQAMVRESHVGGRLSVEDYHSVLRTLRAGNEAALALAISLSKPPEERQLGDRALRVLGDVLPLLATQLGPAGAKIAAMAGDVQRISVQQAREDEALLTMLRERAQENLATIDASLKAPL